MKLTSSQSFFIFITIVFLGLIGIAYKSDVSLTISSIAYDGMFLVCGIIIGAEGETE